MTDRSLLFVPGNRPERFDKACAAGADITLIDLEDAVAPADKAPARDAIRAWLDASKSVYLRINGADTDWFQDDLALLVRPGVRGVVLPKAEHSASITEIHGVAHGLAVIALIESALGLRNVESIASAGIARFAFGSIDFQLDLGIAGEREELLFARSSLVFVSRLAGLPPPVDGVTVALDDPAQLANDIAYARRLGFGGKLCIHPRQVDAVNAGFLPPAADVDWATRVLEAAEQAGGNAVRLDGKMIDRPVIDRARAIVQSAQRGGT
ncbi:MAG: HpcH/HpaI aldolase/citrate lyase family protein [Burkholderiaceae bacterium]